MKMTEKEISIVKTILVATLTEKLLEQKEVVATVEYKDTTCKYTFRNNSGLVSLYEVLDGTGYFDEDVEVYAEEYKHIIESIQQNKVVKSNLICENLGSY